MENSQNIAFRMQESRWGLGFFLLSLVLFIKPISILGKKYANARIITAAQGFEILKDIVHTHKRKPQLMITLKDLVGLAIDAVYSISLYLMRFRRQLGVAAFWTVLVHGGLWQVFRHRQEIPFADTIGENWVITGFVATIALLVGALTSNNMAMRQLKAKWKTIQSYAAYIAFGFAAVHTGNIFALIVYIFLKYYEAKETKHQAYLFIQKYKNKFIG